MCPYPQRAQYRGSGATTDAANFVCVGNESDSNGPIIADFGRRETILGYLFYCSNEVIAVRHDAVGRVEDVSYQEAARVLGVPIGWMLLALGLL